MGSLFEQWRRHLQQPGQIFHVTILISESRAGTARARRPGPNFWAQSTKAEVWAQYNPINAGFYETPIWLYYNDNQNIVYNKAKQAQSQILGGASLKLIARSSIILGPFQL